MVEIVVGIIIIGTLVNLVLDWSIDKMEDHVRK